jgi:enamine deaminase RidA (YjgF/YER057c/UK114 family)
MSAEANVKKLGLDLSHPPAPVGNYVGGVIAGKLLFMSGHGPRRDDGTYIQGKVGINLNMDEAYQAARQVGISMLSSMKALLGDLDKVNRAVKVLGMVNATPEFGDHPKVVNGFSDLMVAVFGESGRHARSAVGMGSLPMNIPVEVEAVFELNS